MALYSMINGTLDINGTAITCLLTVSTSETVDIFVAECAGSTFKQKVAGLTDASMSVTFNTDDSDVTEENALRPNTIITSLTFQPAGAGSGLIEITSTGGIIEGVDREYGTTALSSGTRSIQLDNLTYALQP